LESGSSDYTDLLLAGLRLQAEEVVEEIEMWLDAKESFAEVDEDCLMQNRIWVQVMDLDAIVV
jgi:hypothetical protein